MKLVSGEVLFEWKLVRPQSENVYISIQISILFDSIISGQGAPRPPLWCGGGGALDKNINIPVGISILFDKYR